MKEKVARFLIVGTGIILFAVLMLFTVNDSTKIAAWRTSGTVHSGIVVVDDSTLTFTRIEASDFILPPVPSSGDTILTIDDSTATYSRWQYFFETDSPPGKRVAINYLHNATLHSTVIESSPVKKGDFVSLLILHILRFLITLSFLVVGLWAYLKRPDSSAIRILALFCFSMAGVMLSAVRILSENLAAFDIPAHNQILLITNILALFFSAFWLNLHMIFPRPNKVMQRSPKLAYAICYLPQTILILIRLFFPEWRLLSPVLVSILVGYLLAGIGLLIRNYFKTRNSLERRQVKIVMWGTALGLLMLFILSVLSNLFAENYGSLTLFVQLMLVNLTFLALLLSPLSIAYAFGRYGLLEVEGRLKRGTLFLVATTVLIGAFLGIVYGIGEFTLGVLNIESRTPTLIIAIVLAIGFTPAQRRVQRFFEYRIYPERQKLRTMIQDFLQTILSYSDQGTFWQFIEGKLKDVLGVENVFPILRDDDDRFLEFESNTETPFAPESQFVLAIEKEGRPLPVDEIIASDRIHLSSEEKVWLTNNRVALILPMIAQSRMLGFLCLGFKEDRKDFAGEDLQILRSLANQVALAYENVRLIEENLVKRRMERELQIARNVQEGFLPQKIPNTPGLDVAARSRFCTEVAGDYYDVISTEDNRTLLAVGDVSGKGAGAALLMANLQASLRTATRMGGVLSEIVAGINDLIVQNTPPEDYITFFVAVFDPAKNELTYVNAGHNPPILLLSDGSTRSLSTGGLILGTLPGMHYEQETIALNPGSMMLLYTDGISEAMNGDEEEFGEDRIEAYLRANRAQNCDKLLENLEKEVLIYRGQELLEDDCTLLLACVKSTDADGSTNSHKNPDSA
ncbi:SpoIIE family protein phosphatase [bacterium]|nr:SpoIIE family protein phosphatase [bacterium]